MENEVMFIKLDDIIPNRFQPREVFDEEALNKLADSIRKHGVIEPILVRPVSNKFEIIAGERRYKASVLAGLTKIPAIVKQMDDKESMIVAFIENEHRSDVSAIEEARTINRILNSNNMTQEELAKELGMNQSTLANKLRLLSLPLEIQESLMHNEISERHARSLLSVKDKNKQIELLNKIKEKRMTVRELDSEIKSMNNENYDNLNNESGFEYMNYMNNYNNVMTNNNQPTSAPMPNPGMPQEAENNDFMNYLNSYDNNQPASAPMPNPGMPQEPENNDFMNYLNSYDNNQPASTPMPNPGMAQEPGNNDYMNYLNGYDNNQPASAPMSNPGMPQEAENNDFMNYLNSYDNNQPASTPMPNPGMAQEPGNNDYMNYLNGYDNNQPASAPMSNPGMPQEPENNDFMNYLNGYDNNQPASAPIQTPNMPQDLGNQDYGNSVTENDYLNSDNYTETLDNNVMINNVNPPITSNFNTNSYVEDNPNFVDVSKNTMIGNVDDIIMKIKNVVDDIKASSKFKIDTDEIDYDDMYQITIKIDKRDF